MSVHRKVRLLLYEYENGELDDTSREMVRAHCSECFSCREESAWIRELIGSAGMRYESPAGYRPDEYWNRFALHVEERIRQIQRPVVPGPFRWYEIVSSYLSLHWKPVAAAATLATVVLAVAITWTLRPASAPPQAIPRTSTAAPGISVQPARYEPGMSDYLRRSKMLFIGISNMKLGEHQQLDLSTEQEVSRELLHQARSIRSKPLDLESARIVDDIQRILIDLANMKEQNDVPGVEILRAGIHQENLIFKIRIAESQFDSTLSVLKPSDPNE